MTYTKTLTFLACAASMTLTGCGTLYSNAKILSEDNANIAVTINKDLSNTVINTHTGERVEPCAVDITETKRPLADAIKKCYPEGHDPNGKILSTTNIVVREGSICATIVSGSRLYVLCQPPYNLGF